MTAVTLGPVAPAAAPPWIFGSSFPPCVQPRSCNLAELKREGSHGRGQHRPSGAAGGCSVVPACQGGSALGQQEEAGWERFATCSLGSFGQITRPPIAGGHLPFGGVETAAVQPAPRKYYCYIDSSVPLARGINFVFVWTVVGFNL